MWCIDHSGCIDLTKTPVLQPFSGIKKVKATDTIVSIALTALVREAGLEPARAYCTLEPESSESANSTTRARQCKL